MQLDINFAGLVTRLLDYKRSTVEQSDQWLRKVYMRFYALWICSALRREGCQRDAVEEDVFVKH